MLSDTGPQAWFVLAVKPRAEKTAAASLAVRSIEHYLPLYRSRRRWSDRSKNIALPLFPGYIFTRFPYERRFEVLSLPSVNSLICFNRVPAEVPEPDLHHIRLMLASGRPIHAYPYLRAGHHVRIHLGPLAGLEGVLARDPDSLRVAVNVHLLNRSVAVEVDHDAITPISSFTPGLRHHAISA